MPGILQEFLAAATQRATADLETALLRLPEEKRNWSPTGSARTALDMVAECAIVNDVTEIVQTHAFPSEYDFETYQLRKDELAKDWETLRSRLYETTERAVAAIRSVPDDDLNVEIALPWGPATLGQVISYPYWNLSYHEGQINYIASMLGCLD